jgi:hypothetical protein
MMSGLAPKSDQSLVTARISNEISIGAVPQIKNPRSGEVGSPPNNGPVHATALTNIEKITMWLIVFLRSVSFISLKSLLFVGLAFGC